MYRSGIVTPFGLWGLCATEQGLVSVLPTDCPVEERSNAVLELAKQQLAEYFAGRREAFSVPLDLHGTAFQMRVWQALRKIPHGQTVCYGDVAADIGKPSAVRAVGQAVGNNPCLVFVPCHRVIGKNGNLTGFSCGLELKKELLALERREAP